MEDKSNERRIPVDKHMGYNQLQIELFLLKGKIEAVGVYMNNDTYPKPEIIAKMLGIEYHEPEKS